VTGGQETESAGRIRRGSAAFRRTNIAFFLSGFSVFALLYSVQPLLPIFSRAFGLDAGQSSLSLSVTTMALAASLLLASGLADRFGRKALMVASLAVAALLGALVPLMPAWHGLLAVRTLLGGALSGVPAVAMVYLAEEMEVSGFGLSVGLYIGGNAIGGMSGRILVGTLADAVSWRFALLVLGLIGIVNALLFWRLLPEPRHSPPRAAHPAALWRRIALQFRDPALRWLYAESFLVMGVFVTLYNYTGFRLSAPPFSLGHAAISLIFVVYLIGTGSSAWIGALAGRIGRRKVLWLMVVVMGLGLAATCIDRVPAIILGLAIVTFGFFGAHSVASSWVARRAGEGKAQASALYLFFYYAGSSVIGTSGGYAWSWLGWNGVLLVAGTATLAALAVAIRLIFLPPLMLPEGRLQPAPAG
jgi:YNFM family putative membrane transporter